MTYKDQYQEIVKLTKSVRNKSKNFVKHADGPYYDDLLSVIKDLKEIDEFLK